MYTSTKYLCWEYIILNHSIILNTSTEENKIWEFLLLKVKSDAWLKHENGRVFLFACVRSFVWTENQPNGTLSNFLNCSCGSQTQTICWKLKILYTKRVTLNFKVFYRCFSASFFKVINFFHEKKKCVN